jgi:hypothetical protein
MTSYLFSAWISHFIESVCRFDVISTQQRHLLILNGHDSHISLDVFHKAKNTGLDLLILSSHTSHALQSLDVCVFKPFKQYFRKYRDFWTSRNMDQPTSKATLAHWVCLALKKALSVENIKSAYSSTGIFPFKPRAVDSRLAPSLPCARANRE